MSQRTFNTVAGVVFFLVGVLHLVRFFSGWALVVGENSIPLWPSIVAALVAWFLSYCAFRLNNSL